MFAALILFQAFIGLGKPSSLVPIFRFFSIGSDMRVRIAAGWIELHRIFQPCCAQYHATVLVWFRIAAFEEA